MTYPGGESGPPPQQPWQGPPQPWQGAPQAPPQQPAGRGLRQLWAAAPRPLRLVAGSLLAQVAIGYVVVVGSNLDDGKEVVATALGSAWAALALLAVHAVLLLLLLRRSRVGWVLMLLYGLLGFTRSLPSAWLTVLSVAVSLAAVVPLLIPVVVRWFWKDRDAGPPGPSRSPA